MGAVVVFQQMLVIFLLILVGYVLFKKGILTESASRAVSAVVVNITNPALLISSALDGGAAVTHREVLAMACVSAGVYAALLTLGALLPRVFRAGSSERKFYNVMAVYANTGFIGIPLVSELLGSEGMIYLVVFNLFFNFLFYTHGRHVLSAGLKDKKTKTHLADFRQCGDSQRRSSFAAVLVSGGTSYGDSEYAGLCRPLHHISVHAGVGSFAGTDAAAQ